MALVNPILIHKRSCLFFRNDLIGVSYWGFHAVTTLGQNIIFNVCILMAQNNSDEEQNKIVQSLN